MTFDDDTLDAIVAAVVQRLAVELPLAPPTPTPTAPCGNEAGHACTAEPRPLHAVERPVYEAMLPKLVGVTPSRVAVGRAGNRFRTDLYLLTREGQADARDAVHSEVPDDWAAKQGLIPLQTRCRERHEYLLYPNQGRRLDDLSRATVQTYASTRPDVQLILGDGLSPNALVQNGPSSYASLKRALHGAGLRTGVDFYVKYARIGVADEIAVLTGARASVILVGERPGLGTGDSLSFYLAVAPKLDQDNAEKNCISNVRPIGIHPDEAASQSVAILKRGLERGVGGVALGLGWGRQ